MNNFRQNVGLCIFNDDGKILLARRADMPEDAFYVWQMPQGGIDDGETPDKAAFREMKEELGTDKAEIIAESKDWHAYEFPKDVTFIDYKTGLSYDGQNQKWMLMRYTGDKTDIQLFAFPEEIEFVDWGWFDIHDVPELVVQFKKEIYQTILKEFAPLIKKALKK